MWSSRSPTACCRPRPGAAGRAAAFADSVLLAVSDALGAVGAQGVLACAGVRVSALSGLLSASPLAAREAADATSLHVVTPDELAASAALDILRSSQWV